MKYYQVIDELDMNRFNVVATVVTGEHSGEKAVFVDHKSYWKSNEKGFFGKISRINTEQTGLMELQGESVFCEVLSADKKLVICGGGHISMPLIRMGRMLGFYVTVVEDRMQFAEHARAEHADEVICDDYVEALEQLESDGNTYFVIVTRGHSHDRECLETIIRKPNAYIGMIGSRSKVKTVMDNLAACGIDKETREAVHTPIGLSIGAETPEEIAVAIMAEIVEEKNKEQRNGGYSRTLLKALLPNEKEEVNEQVLATIISRKGSAPREVGTKMLIGKNGEFKGTIGGGCIEAEVINRARHMLSTKEKEMQICAIDMTNQDAGDEGMVCGGIEEVLLEVV
ncbi:MAG: XdhC family protein [Eubacterium sp.]|nr:XdhC family protein [Eubacterium sp.]